MDSLLGTTLLSKDGNINTNEALVGKKAVAIYFSAHWCPPCRGFTPKLAEWYKADLQAKGMEVVFVSSDRDRKDTLSKKYKVSGIPSMVILDMEGKLITKDG